MGVESAPGSRPSASSGSSAHYGVCPSRDVPASDDEESHAGAPQLRHTLGRSTLADGVLARKPVPPPAGWNPALSSRPSPLGARTTRRAQWHATHRVCRQHYSLSSLSAARTMPGIWGIDEEAAPGQCSAPSTCRPCPPSRGEPTTFWNRSAAVARLEPLSDATGVDAALAQPTGRSAGWSTTKGFSSSRAFAPLPSTACPLASLLG
jgi:hypothetical protein